MDQVLGNEHTTKPPILIAPLSENVIMENTECGSTAPPTRTPSPRSGGLSDEDTTANTDSFNSGQKVRRKGRNDKVDTMVDLMMQHLEIKEEEKEEKRKQGAAMVESLARSEEREQQFLNIFKDFTNHVMGRQNTAVQE
jgi:hypothetical protein